MTEAASLPAQGRPMSTSPGALAGGDGATMKDIETIRLRGVDKAEVLLFDLTWPTEGNAPWRAVQLPALPVTPGFAAPP